MFRSLRLQQFRSYTDFTTEFSGGVTIIIGPNGSGKTNLLEALYVLSTGSSFRVADRDMVQRGHEWFRLDSYWNDQERSLTYQLHGDKADKQYNLDGIKRARLTHNYRIPVVLFEPDHLRLLSGSPAARRDYLDSLLTRLHPDFSWLKHQFERALSQRNTVLKRRLSAAQLDDYLFVWDIKLSELAAQIIERRLALLHVFADKLSEVYSRIAQVKSLVVVDYIASVPAQPYQEAMVNALHVCRKDDAERGFTTIGPHRDDFSLKLNGSYASVAASRGEVRSLLLALKIIELEMLAQKSATRPFLLLDDVFSELDASRRRSLAELARTHQTFITTTDADATVKHFLVDYQVIRTG